MICFGSSAVEDLVYFKGRELRSRRLGGNAELMRFAMTSTAAESAVGTVLVTERLGGPAP